MQNQKPVLHILVVGFHHKKGCQVEFSYPPLVDGTEGKSECPSGWKYLPTLALPDGSHNFSNDFVCFNLPSLTDPEQSVYGISCYRQIALEEVKIRTADLTRSTVQKSVCTLLSLPIYGYVEVKLSLIAQAFFEQGDFSSTDILVKAYEQLNACLTSLEPQEIGSTRLHFVGVPLRDLLLKWRHKILILFKLLLLQKRVVCFGSPVHPTCALILGIASLHPELISKGFQQVACVKTSRPMSPMPTFSTPVEEQIGDATPSPFKLSPAIPKILTEQEPDAEQQEPLVTGRDADELIDGDGRSIASAKEAHLDETVSSSPSSASSMEAPGPGNPRPAAGPTLHRDTSVDTIASNFSSLYAIEPSEWGAPLRIFHEGQLCLPYISLPYMDLLTDPSVKGYIIGASNVLFQHKRQLADVIIDVETAIIDVLDVDTKREIQLSTEDLRFVDFVVRHVQTPKEDAEGSETWIRDQLYGYMVALLKTSLNADGSKEIEHFNTHFMGAFKATRCYGDWLERTGGGAVPAFEGLVGGHPFAGTLSVADMKLRIAQTMQNSESGRKLNQAVTNTSRAVGGALTTAKGAFSSWWTSFTAPPQGGQLAQAADHHPPDTSEPTSGEENSPGDHSGTESESPEATLSTPEAKHIIPTAELSTQPATNSVVEIGREAELLDRGGGRTPAIGGTGTDTGSNVPRCLS
ncbi:late secretory pathway protein AVL9 homolog [Anopheles stephensi]|uniref:late secretory pathway protein AVL9 homolog n=1 Tax=Anopheles stephensi TaxID=30069 RepID=UPI0007D16719|nr:late secretory pathway protein AVL9 homolog [Anopheles stephensi]XP_035901004.1 late secretory pathway protein AVL9 homolog [Anopheles stephensi]